MQELKGIFGDDVSRPATIAELKEMKYLEAVIKEALRLYPSVPIYGRNVAEDTEYGKFGKQIEDLILEGVVSDGGVLPKDLSLGIFVYGLHRKPELFPDPEKFDPERFLDGGQQVSPFGYLPFSAGPRNCIGQ